VNSLQENRAPTVSDVNVTFTALPPNKGVRNAWCAHLSATLIIFIVGGNELRRSRKNLTHFVASEFRILIETPFRGTILGKPKRGKENTVVLGLAVSSDPARTVVQ
jgi:hypothetical protein